MLSWISRPETRDLAGVTRPLDEAPEAFHRRSLLGSTSRFYWPSLPAVQSKRTRIAERNCARNRLVSACAEGRKEARREGRTAGRGYTETATWMKCGLRNAECGLRNKERI